MIQQTQDQWLESKYVASSYEGGIDFPDLKLIAEAFDIHYEQMTKTENIQEVLGRVLNYEGSVLCNIEVDPSFRVIPQVKAGSPNESMEPTIEELEYEFRRNKYGNTKLQKARGFCR